MSEAGLKAEKIIFRVLQASSGISTLLMMAGLAFFLFAGKPFSLTQELRVLGLSEAVLGAVKLEPVSLMTLGILILIFTPLIRVAGAIISFWFFEKDRKYALVSLGVMLIILISMAVPGVH